MLNSIKQFLKAISALSSKCLPIIFLFGLSQLSHASKTEAQAVEEAKKKHGGKVVEVKKLDDKFKVKLLLADGRVILVTVDS